jgi:hypothetical protein
LNQSRQVAGAAQLAGGRHSYLFYFGASVVMVPALAWWKSKELQVNELWDGPWIKVSIYLKVEPY